MDVGRHLIKKVAPYEVLRLRWERTSLMKKDSFVSQGRSDLPEDPAELALLLVDASVDFVKQPSRIEFELLDPLLGYPDESAECRDSHAKELIQI